MGVDMDDWTPEKIKNLRTKMGLTQVAFAERIGVTNVYVNYLEKGVKTPSRMLCILLSYVSKEAKRKRKGG